MGRGKAREGEGSRSKKKSAGACTNEREGVREQHWKKAGVRENKHLRQM